MELTEIKSYLRLESNFTEDDVLLTNFIASAESYIKNTTGKTFIVIEGGEQYKIYDLAVQMLVSHWYSNRAVASDKPVNDLPYSLNAIINHLSLCSAYE